MKQILILTTIIVLIISVFLYFNKPVPLNDDIIIDGVSDEEVMIIDEDDIPKELIREIPDGFINVEMTTYRSVENNYEITYPKEWVGILAPKGVVNKPQLESYEIYPIDIPYGPSPIFDIDIYNETFEEFIKDMIDIEDLTKISLNDLSGYRFSIDKKEGNFYYIFNLDKDTIISIVYWPDEEYHVSEEEAMWVLSTLKVNNK